MFFDLLFTSFDCFMEFESYGESSDCYTVICKRSLIMSQVLILWQSSVVWNWIHAALKCETRGLRVSEWTIRDVKVDSGRILPLHLRWYPAVTWIRRARLTLTQLHVNSQHGHSHSLTVMDRASPHPTPSETVIMAYKMLFLKKRCNGIKVTAGHCQ